MKNIIYYLVFIGLAYTTGFNNIEIGSDYKAYKYGIKKQMLSKEAEILSKKEFYNSLADKILHMEGRPDCPDGFVDDCSGDGDCCPEPWIGDGNADCSDQAYGCDLTCYDCDGGDCDDSDDCDDTSTTTTTTSGGGECPDGYVEDCADDDCCPESWIGDGFADCEDQAFGCDLTCYDNDGGDCAPECGQGDINCDGSLDVIDVVLLVNAIIEGGALDNGDMNDDGSLDVIDVVILVNAIIDGTGRGIDADEATVITTDNSLTVKGNGYIGGIQIMLYHDHGFELNLTDDAMVSEYKTTGTSTILVVVVPENELIFTSNQSFEIVDMIIANSHEEN